MNRRQAMRPAEDTPEGIAQKHHRTLLHALHIAHPVIYQDKQRFIHTITYMTIGGSIKAVVYLSGDHNPVEPADVQLQEITE